MSKKNRHHYIPASYLAGFTEEWHRKSRLWGVPKNNEKPFPTNPEKICVKKHYYKIKENVEEPNVVENWYAKSVEGPIIGSFLTALKDREIQSNIFEHENVFILLATLYLRIPQFRERIASSIERDAEICISMFRHLKNITDKEAFDIKANKSYLIKEEINLIEKVATILARRPWKSFSIPDDLECEFITSDKPFVLSCPQTMNKGNYGIGTLGTEVVVPINKRTIVISDFSFKENGFSQAKKNLVGAANLRIIMSCYKYFYSSRKKIILSDSPENIWYHDISKIFETTI